MAFRFSSVQLLEKGKPLVMRECPVGMIIREAPYVYDAIRMQTHMENGALSPLDLSPWARSAASVVSSERARLREKPRKRDAVNSASDYGQQVRSGR
jgi:hypothetical protein